MRNNLIKVVIQSLRMRSDEGLTNETSALDTQRPTQIIKSVDKNNYGKRTSKNNFKINLFGAF